MPPNIPNVAKNSNKVVWNLPSFKSQASIMI